MTFCFVAFRDAVMTIHHFGTTLNAVNASLKKAPSLNANRELVRSASSQFFRSFPDWGTLRNAVAHYPDLLKNPQTVAAASSGTGSLAFMNASGRTLSTTTRGGKPVSYNLDAETWAILSNICKQVLEACGATFDR